MRRLICLSAVVVSLGCGGLFEPPRTTGTIYVTADSLPVGVAATVYVNGPDDILRRATVFRGEVKAIADAPFGSHHVAWDTVRVLNAEGERTRWAATPNPLSAVILVSRTTDTVGVVYRQITGSLQIFATGLPEGASLSGGIASSVSTAEHRSFGPRIYTSSGVLVSDLPAGAYSVYYEDVWHMVSEGDFRRYRPNPRSLDVTVVAGGRTAVTTAYYP